MDSCFSCDFSPRKVKMRGKFYIEGHKSKGGWEDEITLILQDDKGYSTLEDATTKAKEYFEKEKDLHLAVIYQEDKMGTKEGAKMMFRDDEGALEESLLFY
jgi:C4-type Zn-finger protein